MRRGFLNQPRTQSKSTPAPFIPTSSDPLVQIMESSSETKITPQDMKKLSQDLNYPEADLKANLRAIHARRNDPDFTMVYHKIQFKDFTGVTLSDAKIINHLPHSRKVRPPALEHAYKISPITGKGFGMIAERKLLLGAIILVENPVIVSPGMISIDSGEDRETIRARLFENLDPSLRSRALSLHNNKPPAVCGKTEGIIRTNGFKITLPLPDLGDLSKVIHSGLFLDLSRCNHSCGPNATHRWDPPTYSMSLTATRTIEKGEEITIGYINLAESREVRRRRLHEMYYFDCECKYCSLPTLEAIAASDAARAEIAQFWKNPRLLKPHEWVVDLTLPDNYLVDILKHCINMDEQEGIIERGYKERLGLLGVVYGMLADETNCKLWGRKGLKILKVLKLREDADGGAEKDLEMFLENPPRYLACWGWRIKEKLQQVPLR